MNAVYSSKLLVTGLLSLCLMFVGMQPALAKYDADEELKKIQKLVKSEKYSKATKKLKKMLRKEPKNPDVLSLMGFSQRKQENYDEAQTYYNRALKINPKHKASNEYLGQLYLEIDQLDDAKERLGVLEQACGVSCSEYRTLKKAIDEYQQ